MILGPAEDTEPVRDFVTRGLGAIAVLIGVLLAATGTALGHSEVQFRAPEADQVLGGEIDHVDIQYWTPVESAVIRVTDPDGRVLTTDETVVSSRGFVVSVGFDPITIPGTYQVDHVEESLDGDQQIGEFQFVFDPDSDVRIESLVASDSGPNWLLLAGIGVIVVGIAGLVIPRRSGRSK